MIFIRFFLVGGFFELGFLLIIIATIIQFINMIGGPYFIILYYIL